MAWSLKVIQTPDIVAHAAGWITKKYIKGNGVMQTGNILESISENTKENMDLSTSNSCVFSVNSL